MATFLFGVELVDKDKTTRALQMFGLDFRNSRGWGKKNKDEFDSVLGFVIDSINNGSITGMNSDGTFHYEGEQNDKLNSPMIGEAVKYAKQIINEGILNKKLALPAKAKFNEDLAEDFKEHFNAGKDLEEANINSFIDLDTAEGEERGTTNRARAYLKMLANKITRLKNGYYDLDEDKANEWIGKLQAAHDALNDGVVSDNEYALLDAAGHSSGDTKILFGKGNVSKKDSNKKTPDDTLKEYRESLEATGTYTDDLINQLVEAERIKILRTGDNDVKSALKDNIDALYNSDYLTYAQKQYGNNRFTTNYGILKPTYGKISSFERDIKGKNILNNYKTLLQNPELHINTLRNVLWYMYQKHPNTFSTNPDSDGYRLIRDSINYDTGKALVYNPKTGGLKETDLFTNEDLKTELRNNWIRNNPIAYGGFLYKDGGILKGLNGLVTPEQISQIAQMNGVSEDEVVAYLLQQSLNTQTNPMQIREVFGNSNNIDYLKEAENSYKKYEAAETTKKLLAEKEAARKAGYQVDPTEWDKNAGVKGLKLYRASQRKIANGKGLDNWSFFADSSTGYKGFEPEDYARLIAMGSDITGLIASFTGVGTVANLGTGLISTVSNLVADTIDDSVTKGLVWKNIGTNLALSAVGFVPGGNSLKIVKNAIKFGPKIFAAYNAFGLTMNDDVRKSWEKVMHDGENAQFTVQDWKNIGASIAALRGVVGSGASMYKNRKFNKMVERSKVLKNNNTDATKDVKVLELTKSDGSKLSLSKDLIKELKGFKNDESKIKEFLTKNNLKEDLVAHIKEQNLSEYLDPSRLTRAGQAISNGAASAKNKVIDLITPNLYEYNNLLAINNFLSRNAVNRNLGLRLAILGRGKYSDAAIWARMNGLKPSLLRGIKASSVLESNSLTNDQLALPSPVTPINTQRVSSPYNITGITPEIPGSRILILVKPGSINGSGNNGNRGFLLENQSPNNRLGLPFRRSPELILQSILHFLQLSPEAKLNIAERVINQQLMHPNQIKFKNLFTLDRKDTVLKILKVNPQITLKQLKTIIYKNVINPLRRSGFKQGGKLEAIQYLKSLKNSNFQDDNLTTELSKMEKGGILKAQSGAWFKALYKLLTLGNEDLRNRNQHAGDTINAQGNLHNQDFGLDNAYLKNQAYTSRNDLVGLDLQHYYDENRNLSLDDFITKYNNDALTIRSTWGVNADGTLSDTDHAANTKKGIETHNRLHRRMFNSRNNTSGEDYSLGYLDNLDNVTGTTSWMRRMDRYEHEFDNLDGNAKKNRIHKITLGNGETGYVYKKANGDIAKLSEDDYNKIFGNNQNDSPAVSTNLNERTVEDFNTRMNLIAGKASEIMSRINPSSVIAFDRYLSNLRHNNKVAKLTKEGLGVVLEPGLNMHTLVIRSTNGESAADRMKALAIASVRNNKTSDATTNTAMLLEAIDKGNQAKLLAIQVADLDVKLQVAASDAERKKLHEYNTGVQFRNDTAQVNQRKAMFDIEAARLAANQLNRNTYSKELEFIAKQNEADYKNFLDKIELLNFLNKVENDPTYKEMYKQYEKATGDEKTQLKEELLKYYRKLIDDETRKMNIAYARNHNIYTGNVRSVLEASKPDKWSRFRKGGTIDDSKVKAKTQDIKEFNKVVQHGIKSHLHMIDNLSRSTLLAIKKALNQ